MKRQLLLIAFLLMIQSNSKSQIIWDIQSDSINLNPEEIQENTNILINNEILSGMTVFNFKNKELYFRDKNGVYRLEKK
jgi:hypothetical protein